MGRERSAGAKKRVIAGEGKGMRQIKSEREDGLGDVIRLQYRKVRLSAVRPSASASVTIKIEAFKQL